jgi:iron-sulfur cluster assembly protein
MIITMTDAASTYILSMIDKKQSAGFRLSIKKTGCSGYSYAPALIEVVNPTDQIIEVNRVKLYVDTAWLDLLNNLHIDYIEEDKSGLKQKRLVFSNPNEASRCGCGESFHIE